MSTTVTADPDAVFSRVRALLGSDFTGRDESFPTASPASADQTAALLRVAREEGWRVLPKGGGIGLGIIPARATRSVPPPDLIISTLRMTPPLEHEPADLTVRAGAGTALSALQESVAESAQWLALDPPGGEKVTLGGIVATGAAGPLRIGYGRPRDQLLGLTMVDGAGRVLALGGRVVKNVAGFDLVRLATGSLGGLGVITEAVFRLYPLPEEDRTLIWSRGRVDEAWELGRSLAALPLPIAAAELVAGEKEPPLDDSGVRVHLRLMGSHRGVSRMREILLAKAGLPVRELHGPDSSGAADRLAREDGEGPVSFRVHTLPDRGHSIATALEAVPYRHLSMHLLQGSFRGTLLPDASLDTLTAVASAARSVGGSIRLLRAVGDLPEGIAGDGDSSTAAARLHARIAESFDPDGILPGAWREGWR